MGRLYAALLVIRGKHLAALTGLQVVPLMAAACLLQDTHKTR